ncbi:MAG: RagB/SusD family nutrient uptake outer membrane protein [Tannerellaceae bacterium]|jgi:hypothetical protein|nr:RagB/SusD family nutrient uptake outer membrane protein [Tannerellaceae bacterium]
MKNKFIQNILGASFIAFIALTLTLPACSDDILEETARNKYEPSFFKTEKGVEGGLSGLYATLRRVYGQPYYYNACLTGTDEYTYGGQADGNFRAADLCGLGIPDASNSRWDVLWNSAYSAINSASGIITNATDAGMPEALIAEARFFRAFYYFQMVQTFGGVPLDLGGGILLFNTTPTRVSTRNTVPEVYTIAIFPDLLKAIEDLPETPRMIGTVTKNTARLILSKAYLTYAWWLENPRDIPTYPACDRNDPDGHDRGWYFQQAYDVATTAIANPGHYGLQPTFYDVNVATNDRNNEIMLWADHTENSAKYSESNVTGWDGGNAQNQAVWMVTWYFHTIKSSSTSDRWSSVDAMFRTVQAGQSYSRMWARMAPPISVFTKTFADKTLDSRFDGTFVTVYRGTWYLNPSRRETQLYNAHYMPVAPNEPILSFLPDDPGGIDYTNSPYNSGVLAGILPGRADYVVPLTRITREIYPGLWKLGAYRRGTDYNDDKVASSRPFNILKFSEFYFIAAEAAVKGANPSRGTARELINVIRNRAGKWKYSVAEDKEVTADNGAALTAATPDIIDINFILDERSREFFGEGYRWHDLARTQKWEEYSNSYQVYDRPAGTIQTINRQLDKYLYLRPIPTSQLNYMEGDSVYKKAYQNPQYN